MLITESGKSEVLGGGVRREAGGGGGGGGRNSNMRNGNATRNGVGHVNGKSAAPALPSKRNVGNGKAAASSGPMHAENRVSMSGRGRHQEGGRRGRPESARERSTRGRRRRLSKLFRPSVEIAEKQAARSFSPHLRGFSAELRASSLFSVSQLSCWIQLWRGSHFRNPILRSHDFAGRPSVRPPAHFPVVAARSIDSASDFSSEDESELGGPNDRPERLDRDGVA